MKINHFILLICTALSITASCSDAEKPTPSKAAMHPKPLQMLKDSCFEQINQAIIELLRNPEALKKRLNLTNEEAILIAYPTNQLSSRQLKGNLIEKLIPLIGDTTDLHMACNFVDPVHARLGDLALFCIYRIESFPFAAALRRQWCTGKAISDSIYLPINFISYTNFARPEIKNAYAEYYHSEDRIEYLEEQKSK